MVALWHPREGSLSGACGILHWGLLMPWALCWRPTVPHL